VKFRDKRKKMSLGRKALFIKGALWTRGEGRGEVIGCQLSEVRVWGTRAHTKVAGSSLLTKDLSGLCGRGNAP